MLRWAMAGALLRGQLEKQSARVELIGERFLLLRNCEIELCSLMFIRFRGLSACNIQREVTQRLRKLKEYKNFEYKAFFFAF